MAVQYCVTHKGDGSYRRGTQDAEIEMKGGMNALDDFCSTCDTLAVGAGERLHDWRIHSYFACHCNRCGADQNNFGTQALLTGWIKEVNPGTKGENKNRLFSVY